MPCLSFLSQSNHFPIFSFTSLCLISSSLTTVSDCIFSCFYFWCGFSLHVYTFFFLFFFFFFENCEWMLFLHEIKDLKSLICILTSQRRVLFPFVKLSLFLEGSSFRDPFPSSVFCYVHYKVMLRFHVHSCPSAIYLETEPWICWKNEVHAGWELGCSVASTFPWVSIWKACSFSQPAVCILLAWTVCSRFHDSQRSPFTGWVP